MTRPLADVQADLTERLSADDQATLAEQQHLTYALHAQRQVASTQARAQPGKCANCGAQCLPQAVYCDADCRADHEKRRLALARLGVGRR